MNRIEVVNRRNGGKGEYVGRPSPLGNPFRLGRDGTRAEVIERYADWLASKVQEENDQRVIAELGRLRSLADEGDLALVCWCAPQACHADVIAEYLRVMP